MYLGRSTFLARILRRKGYLAWLMRILLFVVLLLLVIGFITIRLIWDEWNLYHTLEHSFYNQLLVTDIISPESLENIEPKIQELFNHKRLPVDAKVFQDEEGTIWRLNDSNGSNDITPHPYPYPKSLGKQVCIMDIDSRPFNGKNEIWSTKPFHWKTIKPWSAGIINHYIYAKIHGYSYFFVRTKSPENRLPVWAEITAMRKALSSASINTRSDGTDGTDKQSKDKNNDLSNCKVIINMDADAIFPHLEVPLEWHWNRWNITENTAIIMPLDPSLNLKHPVGWPHYNYDDKGNLWTNPGFFTLFNKPISHEILASWDECPDNEEKYPGCSKYRSSMSAEMGAFANYVRYKYHEHIKEVPCTEGNGYPEMMTECRGVFVRHYTTDKTRVAFGVTQSLARLFMEVIHETMLSKTNDIVVDYSS